MNLEQVVKETVIALKQIKYTFGEFIPGTYHLLRKLQKRYIQWAFKF